VPLPDARFPLLLRIDRANGRRICAAHHALARRCGLFLGDLHAVHLCHMAWPHPAHAHAPVSALPFGPTYLAVPPIVEEWQPVRAFSQARRHDPLAPRHISPRLVSL